MLELANFISVLPLYYIIFTIIILLYCLLLQNNLWKNVFIYFCGLMVALFLPEFLKNMTLFFNIKNPIFYRPNGAKGCDFQSQKGFAKPFTPGFPSGDMTLTTYIMIFNLLILYNKKLSKLLKYLLIIINLIFIVFMSWARHFKKCHNIFQIIGGILLGTIIAKIFFDMLN